MLTTLLNESEEVHISYSPEKRLLYAILERTMGDLKSGKTSVRWETIAWVSEEYKEGKTPPPFSFEWILNELGLDKARFLRSVVNYKTRSYRSL